ncbi:MAG TPA: hypothetical protein DCE41_37525 [Cytophagales bacterium]|nr:hypothetical protein [Cytophagales bacterium]HAA19144.1 hypothetical protein [Cytophagales bacterium]HAP63408.1 hypothetical protein [Cytophagales bacterium]
MDTTAETTERVRTVLVVDDEPESFSVLRKHLKAEPYKLLYTPRSKDTLSIALSESPTLILLDWVMPEMDGMATLEILKANPQVAEIPVMMFTGHYQESVHLQEALEKGAVDFLHKPVDPVVLRARLANVMRQLATQEKLLELEEREKQRLQDEVDHKKRELISQSMQRHELESLLQEVQRLVVRDSLSPTQQKVLVQRIQAHLGNHHWEGFQKHFEEVHPRFFQQLKDRHSGKPLTPTEQKLAAYLKMGLRNQEIANLLDIGKDSLNTSLHRMKKKLNLTPEESMRDFMQRL